MMTPNPDPRILKQLKQYFASGYFEEPDASQMRRWSRAVRRNLEYRSINQYEGTRLFPSGPWREEDCDEDTVVVPSYSYTWGYSGQALENLLANAEPEQRDTLEATRERMENLHRAVRVMTTVHTLGGGGYTHSIPNYGRVIREGLNSYEQRIHDRRAVASEVGCPEKVDFYDGLLDVLEGIRGWHRRVREALEAAKIADPEADARRQRLLSTLERVPLLPAGSFFEAIVAYNVTFYLDGCDNPGRVDQELLPLYLKDVASGDTNAAEAEELIREFWVNADVNHGWSAAIGGTDQHGAAAYNELTLICLRAARHMRRPNLQLHIRKDMPDEYWEEALNTVATGTGLPALHNEEEFIRSLRDAHLGIREADLGMYNGGGCTETMIHGYSNVGSLDAGINLPLVLVDSLDRILPVASTFNDVTEAFKEDVGRTIREIVDDVNLDQEAKSKWRPHPMRSLIIDDCIENGVEYNSGGARYNWSVNNVGGLANVVDSLAAVQEVVFQKKEISGTALRDLLRKDFAGEDSLRQRLERCPRFGNDHPAVDAIAKEISDFVFREFLQYSPWRGGKFLASCLMFVTYAAAGVNVGATPDGRMAGAPLADSAGPVQGRDQNGPTAAIHSLGHIPHYLAPGTLVVNMRFSKEMFGTQQSRNNVKALIRTYFGLGGMQLQLNVVDQEVLRDAIAHPEKHSDLIVRIGGYSEYFNRLSEDLKRTVLERTEHSY